MAILLSFQIRDGEDQTTSIPFYSDTATAGEAATFAVATIPLLDAVIGGRVTGYTITENFASGILSKANPVAGSRNDAGATLSFRTANQRSWSHYLPSFLASKIVNKKVNADDAAVLAYRDHIVAGAAGFLPQNENYSDVISYRDGNQSTRDS